MENRIKSVFGDYASELQVLVDANLDRFKEPFFPKYFTMGSPQSGLSYATAIGRTRIEAAASIVAHGSEAPLRSRAGLEKFSGEVAAIKVKRKMDESEYRNWMMVQQMNLPDESKKQQIIQLIWDDVKYVVDSVRSRLDVMVKQAMSSGNVTIDVASNPEGSVMGDINLLVEADNSGNPGSRNGTAEAFGVGLPGWDTSGTADAVQDISAVVTEIAEPNGIVYEKVIMTPAQWRQVSRQTLVMARFGTEEPTLDEMNNYLSDRQLPIIELAHGRHAVETAGRITNITPWNDERVVFVPAGNLGIIHNALAVEEISPVPTVDYAISDRTLVSKWAQTEPFGELTRGEIAAFPGLEAADQMLFVNVENNDWA